MSDTLVSRVMQFKNILTELGKELAVQEEKKKDLREKKKKLEADMKKMGCKSVTELKETIGILSGELEILLVKAEGMMGDSYE